MRYLLLLLLFFSLSACEHINMGEKDVKTPDNLLSQEVFTNLYYDAQLTEAAVRNEISKGTNSKDISRYLYQQLFEKYGITDVDFNANLKYYASDPEVMQAVQTEIVNRLTKKESELINQ